MARNDNGGKTMATAMKNESIFKGILEFTGTDGNRYRATSEGAAWGVYEKSGDAFMRFATIRRRRGDKPADVYARATDPSCML